MIREAELERDLARGEPLELKLRLQMAGEVLEPLGEGQQIARLAHDRRLAAQALRVARGANRV